MKVELSKDGVLSVIAENGTESYAINHWFELFSNNKPGALLQVDCKTTSNK